MDKSNHKNIKTLLDAAGSFKRRSIGVIGDIMLDRFIFGDTERISPEAPVPVVRQQRELFMPGGAGNVANNLASLGCKAILYGAAGNDMAGKKLLSVLKRQKIDTRGIIMRQGYATTEKIRIIARSQQVLRIDRELEFIPREREEKQIISLVAKNITRWDALIISDYVKGFVTRQIGESVIKLAYKKGIPVIVDSKQKDIARYKQATVITPNRKEAENITGLADCEKAGRVLQKKSECNVLITEGSAGMSLFYGKRMQKFPAVAREVFDVSGAGDTVVALLALSLASGLSLVDSARLANYAAGIVVGKVGTAALETDELINYLKENG